MKILIKNGLLVDPGQDRQGYFDILLAKGRVAKVGKNLKAPVDEIITAKNMIVAPGLIDIHVHCRDFKQAAKETIKTASWAAAAGGVTTCLLMPNSEPVLDSPTRVKLTRKKIKEEAIVNIYIAAAVGIGLGSEKLAPLEKLKKAGAIAFTNDGKPFSSLAFLSQALRLAKKLNIPILSHCEDLELTGKGVINQGRISRRLKVIGIPRSSEFAQLARELAIAYATGSALHFMHISSRESVALIRLAKKSGIKISCETAPHFFSITDQAVMKFMGNARVNPPLKEKKDVEAVISGLADDTIDCIATDHAPHAQAEKSGTLSSCANGLVGLETSLPLLFTKLIDSRKLKLKQAIAKLTINPSKILNLKNKGHLGVGADADLVIVDPNKKKIVAPGKFYSQGRNTPLAGEKLKGWPIMTIVAGKVIMKNGEIYGRV